MPDSDRVTSLDTNLRGQFKRGPRLPSLNGARASQYNTLNNDSARQLGEDQSMRESKRMHQHLEHFMAAQAQASSDRKPLNCKLATRQRQQAAKLSEVPARKVSKSPPKEKSPEVWSKHKGKSFLTSARNVGSVTLKRGVLKAGQLATIDKSVPINRKSTERATVKKGILVINE